MMRSASLVAAMVVLSAAAGCGSSGGSSGGEQAVVPQRFTESGETVQASVTAPREAAYTIYCRDFSGENHAAVAEKVKQQVEQVSGLKDLYLVRGEARTVLYHGFYKTFDATVDRKEAGRAKADRNMLESLVDAQQAKIFPRTVFEPLERPDPEAPAEWNLENAKGYWTLLVITYTDPVNGKQAAVESVREARKQGYDAYYFHKDSQSHVCIGSWPSSAVKRGQSMQDDNWEKLDEGSVDLIEPRVKVVSMSPLDERWKNMRDDKGRPLELYEMRVELLDPTLKKLYGELGYSVNGVALNREFPLLLQVPLAVGRADELESKPMEAAPQADQSPLLRRY
jgi:hypothetical protein